MTTKDPLLLPWLTNGDSIYDGTNHFVADAGMDSANGHVSDKSRARAAFIVRAVNHHERLTDVLRAITADYVELGDSGDAGNWNPREQPPIRAALDLLAALDADNA